MTVNEVITQLQKMISNGEITGNEPFGQFEYAGCYGKCFDEVKEIHIQKKWKDWKDHGDVVYISNSFVYNVK